MDYMIFHSFSKAQKVQYEKGVANYFKHYQVNYIPFSVDSYKFFYKDDNIHFNNVNLIDFPTA